MEDLGNNIFKIDKVNLMTAIMKKRNNNWRLGQICCSYLDGIYDVTYSFVNYYELEHIRLQIPEDEELPSISRIYSEAILYENEMKELFGLKVEQIQTQTYEKLYQIEAEHPFVPSKGEK